MRLARLFAALTLVLPVAFFVGSSPTRAEESGYISIAAADGYFNPEVTRVPIGTTIEWTNIGRNVHTITADDGSFDSGDVQSGGTYRHTFESVGAYRYYCIYHGAQGGRGMAGVILVGDAPLPGRGTNVGPGREAVPSGPGAIIRVPTDHSTIQAAVDAASPGDMVLIGPGIYHEAVRVFTPYLTIRGADRNRTVLDGDYKLGNGLHVEEADGVVVENLTARHYRLNGLFWNGVNGYRASYVSAYGNGDYGIYAFNSTWGRFDHDYAAGNPDSGFYIGQCQPCHALVTDVISVDNAVGFSGTNAGGDLLIVNSEWAHNMSGIAPNTLDRERLAPQHGATVAGNWVHDNNNRDAPATQLTGSLVGIGIVVTGALDDVVQGNLVANHEAYGIAVFPIFDANLWLTGGNRVTGNRVSHSGIADLALGAVSTGRDCFSGNDYQTTMPALLEFQDGCGTDGSAGPRPGGGAVSVTTHVLASFVAALNGHGPGGNWARYPNAPAQPQMPDPTAAPVFAEPEVGVPGTVTLRTLDQINPVGAGPPIAQEVTFMGLPLASASPAAVLIGLYGYAFPLILYVAWVVLALWDLARREDLTDRRRLAWTAAVLVVPLLGPLAYLIGGGSAIPRGMRWFVMIGGIVIYAALAALGFLLA
jgi:plastocyanin